MKTRFLVVDILRVFAVLLVLLFHFFPKTFYFGFIGVDVFYIISGYVIANSINSKNITFTWIDFLNRRFFRLFPNLFILVLVVLFIFSFLFPIGLLPFLFKTSFSSLGAFSNLFYGTVSGYFDIISEINPLLHTWSLSVEWQFYFIVTLILFVSKSKKSILRIVWFLSLLSFLTMIIIMNDRPTFNFYSIFTRFHEFGFGFLLFVYKDFFSSLLNIKKIILTIGLSTIIILFLYHPDIINYWPNPYIILLEIIICLIISLNIEIKFLFVKKIILWFSDRSYGIYLIHYHFAAC